MCCNNALADARIKRKRDIKIHQGSISRAVSFDHLLYRLQYDQPGSQPIQRRAIVLHVLDTTELDTP